MRKLVTLLVLVWSLPLRAEEWPMWRGPKLDGHSSEKNLPVRWSESENVAWKVPVSGKGHSSPIVWGIGFF